MPSTPLRQLCLIALSACVAQAGQERPQMAEYGRQAAELRTLGNDLSDGKVRELREMLRKNTSEQKTLGSTEWNSVKNDLLDKLIAQKSMPPGLGEQIVEMYRNKGNDQLWRDYCVQHMTLYHWARWPDGKAPRDDKEAEAIRAALWEAVEETDGTIAATALLGLERLSRTDKLIDRARVESKALIYAGGASYPSITRTTALQVCAEMGLKEILPAARLVARDAKEPALRNSAIAAIGRLGSLDDVSLLEKISADSHDPLVKKAAAAAKARIAQANAASSVVRPGGAGQSVQPGIPVQNTSDNKP